MKKAKTFSKLLEEVREQDAKREENYKRAQARHKRAETLQKIKQTFAISGSVIIVTTFTAVLVFIGFVVFWVVPLIYKDIETSFSEWFDHGLGSSDFDRYCVDSERAAENAYYASQLHVRRLLRDPESAIFPLESIKSSWSEYCSFAVIGSVRAKNGFGGYSNHVYSVVVRYDVATENFRYSDFGMY